MWPFCAHILNPEICPEVSSHKINQSLSQSTFQHDWHERMFFNIKDTDNNHETCKIISKIGLGNIMCFLGSVIYSVTTVTDVECNIIVNVSSGCKWHVCTYVTYFVYFLLSCTASVPRNHCCWSLCDMEPPCSVHICPGLKLKKSYSCCRFFSPSNI